MLRDTDARPCHARGCKPNAWAEAHYNRVLYNHVALHGAWEGWRLAGRDLIAPDRQRISPERLRGLLWRQASENRLDVNRLQRRARSSQLVLVPARERFDGQA